jgi:hypothetical protein
MDGIYFEKIDDEVVLRAKHYIEDCRPMIHDVKSWMHFFQAIKSGAKVHDLRKNDRNYNIGDVMLYREYDFIGGKYTNRTLEATITYMTDSRTPCAFSSAILPADYCILSIKVRQ